MKSTFYTQDEDLEIEDDLKRQRKRGSINRSLFKKKTLPKKSAIDIRNQELDSRQSELQLKKSSINKFLSLIQQCSDLNERDLQLSDSQRKITKQHAFTNAIL